MSVNSARRWIGFVASIICTMFCGIILSFNVIAVPLKTTYNLSQAQVELLGSCTISGCTIVIIGTLIIKRFGYKVIYIIISIEKVVSSAVLWFSTHHVEFFRERVWILCLLLFVSAGIDSMGNMVCTAIGVKQFSSKHSGKVIGAYLAASAFGKVYYSVLFQWIFRVDNPLGQFYITLSWTFPLVLCICYFTHQPPGPSDKQDKLTELEVEPAGTPHEVESAESIEHENTEPDSTLKLLFSSQYFYLLMTCFGLFQGITYTLVDNITSIGESVGVVQYLNLVYVLSFTLVVTRVICGWIFDKFQSQLCGTLILIFSYAAFVISILICLFCLDNKTVYIMTFLSAIGCGAGYSIPLAMLAQEYGSDGYPLIVGLSDLFISAFLFIFHILTGITYEVEFARVHSTELFCKVCFRGMFLILLAATIVTCLLKLLNIVVYSCTEKTIN